MSWCIGSRAAYKKAIANKTTTSKDKAGLSGQISQKRETSMTRTPVGPRQPRRRSTALRQDSPPHRGVNLYPALCGAKVSPDTRRLKSAQLDTNGYERHSRLAAASRETQRHSSYSPTPFNCK